MKKTTRALLAPLLAFSLLLFSCANDIDSDSTTAGIDSSNDDSVTLTDNDGKSDKDTRKDGTSTSGNNNSNNTNNNTPNTTVTDFGDNFIRGFDASAVDYYETISSGSVTYKDTDGTELDFFKILVNHGYDTVRLRIWNDPSQVIVSSDNPPTGDNTLERTISMAKRIKSAGLKLMLDFHYSDYWTDPSKQYVPREWLTAESSDDVATLVSEYTTEVLTELKNQAEITPAYVQIGNEINSGMIRDDTTPSSINPDFAYAGTGDTQTKYLKSASEAVRAFDDSIKIIVHVTSSNQPASLLNRLKTAELDYDIIGLSYYPWENNHGTISDMIDKVSSWKTTYSKDVIIAETSAQFADEGTSDKLTLTKTNMVDPDTSSVYSDLEMDDDSTYVKGTVANAKAVLRHIMQETYGAGGIGCCAWGGEMHGDWDRAMFDWNGKAMDNIDAFNYKPSEGYPTESGGSETPTYDEMTVNLTFAESIGATSVKITYYDGNDITTESVEADVSNNSATLTLTNKYANEWSYENIGIEITGSNTEGITLSGDNDFDGNTTKAWFKFAAGGTLSITCSQSTSTSTNESITGSFDTSTGAYVGDGTLIQIATADSVSSQTFDYITIDVTEMDWSNTTGDWSIGYATSSSAESTTALSWVSDTEYKITISDESVIASAKQNGIYLSGLSGVTGTVSLTYGTNPTNTQETTLATNTEFTMTGTNGSSWSTDTAVESSVFGSYSNISKIVVSISFDSDLTWGNSLKLVAGSTWLDTGSWSSGVVTFTVTDSTNISDLISNGVKVGSDYNGMGYATVTITYTN